MSEVRDRAEKVLSEVPPFGQQVASVGPTAALFTKLTGVTQATLSANWAGGGIMTTCNAFTGWFSKAVGCKEYLGRFDLDTYLPKIGKGYAWVKSDGTNRPGYGDIVRFKSFHVGVSLDFEGDTWNTAESGQGGPKMGHDVLKRKKKTPYDGSKVLGWVDLALYFGEEAGASESEPLPEQLSPVPDWLCGWWTVMWRNKAFYYYFDRQRGVKWTYARPDDTSMPPRSANDTGSSTVEGSRSVTVKWNATGSVEKFERVFVASADEMRGKWRDTEPLTAVKGV